MWFKCHIFQTSRPCLIFLPYLHQHVAFNLPVSDVKKVRAILMLNIPCSRTVNNHKTINRLCKTHARGQKHMQTAGVHMHEKRDHVTLLHCRASPGMC